MKTTQGGTFKVNKGRHVK